MKSGVSTPLFDQIQEEITVLKSKAGRLKDIFDNFSDFKELTGDIEPTDRNPLHVFVEKALSNPETRAKLMDFCRNQLALYFPEALAFHVNDKNPRWIQIYVDQCLFYKDSIPGVDMKTIFSALRGDVLENLIEGTEVWKRLLAINYARTKSTPHTLGTNDIENVQIAALPYMAAMNDKDGIVYVYKKFSSAITPHKLLLNAMDEALIAAIANGNAEMTHYLHVRHHRFNRPIEALRIAAGSGKIASLVFLKKNFPDDLQRELAMVLDSAASNFKMNVIEWCFKNYPSTSKSLSGQLLTSADLANNVKVVRFLFEKIKQGKAAFALETVVSVIMTAAQGDRVSIIAEIISQHNKAFVSEMFKEKGVMSEARERAKSCGAKGVIAWIDNYAPVKPVEPEPTLDAKIAKAKSKINRAISAYNAGGAQADEPSCFSTAMNSARGIYYSFVRAVRACTRETKDFVNEMRADSPKNVMR